MREKTLREMLGELRAPDAEDLEILSFGVPSATKKKYKEVQKASAREAGPKIKAILCAAIDAAHEQVCA